MSVFVTGRPEMRPYSGYGDPSLPIGTWIAQVTGTGDATGGSVFLTVIFQEAETGFRLSQMWNVEQISMDMGTPTNLQGLMTTRAMNNLSPQRIAAEERWGFLLLSDGANQNAIDLAALAALPLWLGAPNDDFSVDSGLRFESVNVDTIDVNITCQGYLWGPRSVLAAGGPQRPPNGLFR